MAVPSIRKNILESYQFFRDYMYRPLQGKHAIYEARGIRLGSAVTPSDWEVFASLLVDAKGNGKVSGIDLGEFEVKSGINDASYEYQYHKETGKAKLLGDMKAGHLFFNHSNFLNRVELRYLDGQRAKVYFNKWLKNYPKPYPQRYRNSLPFGWVTENATTLLTINDGSFSYIA